MTGRHSVRRGLRARLRPRLDLASVPGRARADAWPLALMAVVLALGVALAALTPRLVARTERDAVETAVAAAGDRATVVVSHGLEDVWDSGGGGDGVELITRLADVLDESAAQVLPGVDPHSTRAILSRSLPLTDVTDPRGETTVRFGYVWHADGPALTWVDGRAPARVPEPSPVPGGDDPPVRVVEIALSEAVAAFLRVGPGDALPNPGITEGPTELRVAGVFRAEDPSDPAWSELPILLEPAARGDEVVLNTAVGMLTTEASFPDLQAALPPGSFTVSYTYRADPAAVADAGADVVAREVGAAIANPSVLATAMWSEVRSDLPEVLHEVLDQVRAARAQGGVLVGAVGGGAMLTLLLAAALLTSRRDQVLAQHRARGGSLAAVLVELLAESVPVAAAGTALGLVAAGAVAQGPVPWWTVGPLAVLALVAPPVLGLWTAARAVGGRKPAAGRRRAGREAVREGAREKAVRRVILEVATLLAAAGAAATAQARDVAAGGLAVAVAPVLLAVAAALVLVRAVPLLLGGGLLLARRSRHAVPVLAAGRARAATRPLALVALTAVVALAGFSAAVAATVQAGREQASWDAVGADATALVRPDDAVAEAAARVAEAPGVDLAAAVRVEQLSFRSTWGAVDSHFVAVDAEDLAALARLTPVGGPDAAGLAQRLRRDVAEGVPALVSADLLEHSRENLGVYWYGSWVPVTAVGPAPPVDGRSSGLVVVDLATYDAWVASGVPTNEVWAVGPGADAAVSAEPGLAGAEVTSRATWLETRRTDPLTATVTASTLLGAALLALLGVLVVVLAAAGGAGDRGRTLATLRAVGVTSRQAWRIAVGELVPPVLVASAFGVAAGAGIARLLGSALDLRLLTGQAQDPVVVVPWWVAAPMPLLVVVVAVVVSVEASTRRRERLGQVLRIGTAR